MIVADYIVKYLEDYGVKHCFSVVGGGSMWLNNSFGKSKKIKTVYMHHEQACAIAAEGYSRVNNDLSVVCVTTGPGGLNCLTGVMGQWTDSVPVLYISGQVDSRTIKTSNLRQLGDQEVDIISAVKPITKFSLLLRDSIDLYFWLRIMINTAMAHRRGPVWIDIPWDVQKEKV
ncbi:MAG: hypothetical protein GY853_01710 [PVC group bacterium]|nr:hypothetical protein [PVC group bacterium]